MPPPQHNNLQKVSFTVALSAAVVFCVIGFAAGMFVAKNAWAASSSWRTAQPPSDVDFAPVWKAWEVIDEKFVPASVSTTSLAAASTTDPMQERVWGMIQGLAMSLDDPYTFFLPPTEQKQFAEDMSGAFEGVGMEIAVRDQILTVVSPLKNSPAERAGLRAGDKILKIDDLETRGLDITTAVARIRGPKGSEVRLLVLRDGWTETKEITVIRDVITVPIIDVTQRGDVQVIELSNFTANSPLLFREALRQFVESGDAKLILDLRGNPGGYLDAAVDMASWFLPPGAIVVEEDYAGHSENVTHRSRGYDIFNDNLRMVILVDRGSASASEILALALKSHGVAQLVGSPTFGKGSVQELIEITPDTALKLTVARWIGPQGEHIPTSGIVPDIEVERTEKDIENDRDPQMERALKVINEL